MELLLAALIGLLTTCGVFLLLRAQTFPVAVGLTLLSYAVNLFLFASGTLREAAPPILGSNANPIDPTPQALVLTAIVIGFAMTAFTIVLALRTRSELGHDHVDDRAAQRDKEPQA